MEIKNNYTQNKEENKDTRLSLTPFYDDNGKMIDGLKQGIKSDGKKYTVRDYRNRYFFPDEWNEFFNLLNKDKNFIFEVLIMTGARIEEALCIKVSNIRWDRNYLTLFITKVKAKKGETKPTPRDISLSSSFMRKLKKYISDNKLKEGDYLFLDNSKEYLTREDLKKETRKHKVAISQMMKRALKKTKIKDWYNFSLHNIRKTHGMWLKALDVKFEEICKRLGHDANTYLKHYGSSDIFDRRDRQMMIKTLGDIYGIQ